VGGALMTIGGAEEALDALEGGDIALTGADSSEDLTLIEDDLSGDGTAEDGLGEDSCTTDPNSFAASTQVTLASGRTEPISDVKPGDEVQATDPVTGKTSPEPVLAVIKGHKTEHLVTLTIRADVHGRMHTGMIVATTGHLIYDLTRHAWVTAGHLHPGDQLDALRGTAAVTAIRGRAPHEATAYNLTVGTDHTYYVATASTAVLVHNCDGEYITDKGLNHSFDEHAEQWFGGNPTRSASFAEWTSLVERTAESDKVVPWSSSGTPTWLHLARLQGKWFAVQFSRETGEMVTAFVPNQAQLGAILRLLH
jgi:hypothetical protein